MPGLESAISSDYIAKLAAKIVGIRDRCLKSEGSRKSWDMNSHRALGVRILPLRVSRAVRLMKVDCISLETNRS